MVEVQGLLQQQKNQSIDMHALYGTCKLKILTSEISMSICKNQEVHVRDVKKFGRVITNVVV